MSKFRATWSLVKQSFAVLGRERKLLVFPVITSFLIGFIFLFFIAPIAFQPTGHSYFQEDHWKAVAESILEAGTFQAAFDTVASGGASEWTGEDDVEINTWFAGYLAAMYLVSMFLLTYFNTAFVNEILHALNGQPVSITGGLRFALTKLKPIVMWSLLAGIVGILIQKLEEYVGFFARWIVALIGVVWSVASVFAVPVLIRDEECDNPFKVLKKSALLIKARWGEGLIGYVGIRTIGAVVALVLIVLFPILIVVLALPLGQVAPAIMMPLVVILIGVWLLSIFLVAYLENVVNKVFQCALYIYAAEGAVPGPYDEALLDAAWKVKKRRTETGPRLEV